MHDKRKTLKHYAEHYCLNCLHFFKTKNKLESHEKYLIGGKEIGIKFIW